MFPSPCGVSFILMDILIKIINLFLNKGFRLLAEYHSFLYKDVLTVTSDVISYVSVSLRSIIHSYPYKNWLKQRTQLKFPSPCGVSFILIF